MKKNIDWVSVLGYSVGILALLVMIGCIVWLVISVCGAGAEADSSAIVTLNTQTTIHNNIHSIIR